VTKPVTLHATFSGGYEGHPMDPAARVGFWAHGTLKRSSFGIGIGIPAPGSTMGVFDGVTIDIETEFTGPALAPASSCRSAVRTAISRSITIRTRASGTGNTILAAASRR
jgi:hypothetical protein